MKNTNNLNKSRLMRLIIAGVIVTITLLTLIMSIGESNVNASAAVNTSTGVTADISDANVMTGAGYQTASNESKYYYTRTTFSSTTSSAVSIPYIEHNAAGVSQNIYKSGTTFNRICGAAIGKAGVTQAGINLSVQGDSLVADMLPSDIAGSVGLAPLYFTFDISTELKHALKDKLLLVVAKPYIRIGNPEILSDSTSADNLRITFSYYHKEMCVLGVSEMRNLKMAENTMIFTNGNAPLAVGEYSDASFFQVTLGGWESSDYLSVAIKEVGIQFEIQPNKGININKSESKLTTTGDNRNANVEDTYTAPGNMVTIDLKLQDGSSDITLDKLAYKDSTEYGDGYKFRSIFLNTELQDEGEEDEYIIRWKVESGMATLVDNGDKSGQKMSFKVVAGKYGTNELIMTAYLEYRVGLVKEQISSASFTVYVDNNAPNRPEFNKNTFYEKYFSETHAYYTESEGQELSPVNDTPVRLDLIYVSDYSTSDTMPYLTDGSLSTKKGSPTMIYYKTSYIGEEVPTANIDKKSTGFDIGEANEASPDLENGTHVGVYCFIGEGDFVEYGDGLFIELFNDSKESVISGVWSIELVSCDYVGNKTICPTKYFIKIDVTDYVFEVKYLFGEEDTINENQVEVSYATVSDAGKFSKYLIIEQNEITLRRGARISLKLKFRNSTAFNTYILTQFTTNGINEDCRRFTYTNYATTLDCKDEKFPEEEELKKYTFLVDDSFVGPDATRILAFRFKLRVIISAVTTPQLYDGNSKTVLAQPIINGTATGSIRVLTTYYTDEERQNLVNENDSNYPISAGTYYFYSELANNDYYYGNTTGSFTINKSIPKINTLMQGADLSITYGESMSVVDMDWTDTGKNENKCREPNTRISSYYQGDFEYKLSSDGIPGYYELSEATRLLDEYNRPNAGKYQIEVVFHAVRGTVRATPEGPEVVYEYDENGEFILNNNYEPSVKTITLYVRHDIHVSLTLNSDQGDDSKIENGIVEHVYNSTYRKIEFEVKSTKEDEKDLPLTEYCLVTYAPASSINDNVDTLKFTINQPVDAGFYAVKIVINEDRCNYSGTFYRYMRIKKVKLDVKGSKDDKFEYQYELTPTVTAKKGNVDVTASMKFIYTFYYYNDSLFSEENPQLEDMMIESNLVKSEDMRNLVNLPESAGKYVVRIDVDDPNHEGFGSGIYTINKAGNDSTHTNVIWPNVYSSTVSNEYNVSYGQPLKAIRISDTYTVKYAAQVYITPTRKTTSTVNVTGKMMVVYCKYETWVEEQLALGKTESELTREAYVSYMQEYREAEYSIFPYSWFVCFVADDSKNYDFIYGVQEIFVGKANLDWSKVVIDNVEYESTVEDISDLTVSKTVGILYSTDNTVPSDDSIDYYKKSNNVYLYVNPDQYTYSLNTTVTVIAGVTNVEIALTHEDTLNYRDSYANSCLLTVDKKRLTVAFDSQGTYTTVYKVYQETDLYDYLVYSGSKNETLPKFTGTFAYENTNGDAVTFDRLVAGEYTVTYAIDNANYEGTVTFPIVIAKSQLSVTQLPEIANESNVVYYDNALSTVTFYNGTFVAEGGETVSGRFSLSAVHSGETFGNAGLNKNIYFNFTPTDTDNYEIFNGSDDNGGYVVRTINKADVSYLMSVAVVGTYYYGDLSYNIGKEKEDFFNTGVVNYALDNSSGKYTDLAWKLSLSKKNGEILPEGKLTAGDYVFTATLDSTDRSNANYKGSVSVGFTVNKKFAVLKVVETSERDQVCTIDGIEGVKKPYAGKSLSIGVRAYAVDDLDTPINESISIDYRVNNSSLGYTPGEIGYYECVMSFTASMNYTLVDNEISCNPVVSARSFLMICIDVDDVKFVNLNQTYTVQKIVNVDLGKNVAECTLTYEDANGVTYDSIPVNAGKYEVYMNFHASDNNGYHEVIKASTLNPNFVLTINKYQADITVSDAVSITYTGKENIPFEAYTSPYGLGLEYAYRLDESQEYTVSTLANLGALNADTYQVLITVNDNNYKGEKSITLVVQKANVSITIAPQFNNYVYNTTDAPTVKEDGKVYCRYDDKEVEGTFYIELDRINTLNVGTHEVVYNFRPASSNYLETSANTTITIDKRVLDDDFLYIYVVDGVNLGAKILENEVYAIEYDNTYHYVEVSYDDSLLYNYAVSNNDFTVSVSYNASANRPRAKGSYVVSAVVSSKNYICQRTWEYEFEVTQCTPYIESLPTTDKVFKIGDEITTADVSGGRAVIKNTGVYIAGTFRVENTTFTKANSAKINVTFTPTDTLLYKEITFTISVNVIGKDSLIINNNVLSVGTTASGTDWTDYAKGAHATSYVINPAFSSTMTTSEHDCGVRIVIKPTSGENSLDYGATLGEFTVSFVPVDDTCDTCNGIVTTLNNCGTLGFMQNSSYVPCVGEKIEVVYKLISGKVEDFETYNVMSGYVSFDGIVDKVDLTNNAAEVIVFEEEPTLDSDYILNIYDKKGNILVGIVNKNGAITLDGSIIYTDDVSTVGIMFMPDNAGNGDIFIVVSTKNYYFENMVKSKRYVSVDESDIIVGKTFKAYDGKAISPEDLDITVRNSQLEIDDSAFSVKIYDSLGNESQGTEIGTYSVVIYLKDEINQYYGTKTVEFIITKRDVSKELSLVKDKDVYDSATVNVVTVKWLDTVLNAYQYSLEFKKASAPDGEYLPNIVFNAGVYHVKVTVNTEFMSGVAVLEYTVSPKSVTLVTGQSSYVYVYGTTIPAPEVGFVDTDTKLSISLDYQLYYHSSSVTQSNVLPESAGDYVVTVKLADTNYTVVNNEFAFIINPKSVTLIKAPSALFTTDETSSYNLKYGQKFGELRLDNSGKVTSSDIDVAGTFKVIDEYIDVIPEAGNKKVTLVFIPNNGNYSSVTCEITVVVAKATATVTFTTLSAKYNGASKASDIKYVVTPGNVPLRIEYKGTTGNYVTDPVSAGNYELRVTSLDSNYEVKVNATANGSAPIFVIYKATVRNVIDPSSVSISVGESLGKSALGGGEVYYEGFNNAVEGTFDFVQSSLVFTESGLKTVQYKFIPTDGINFATYVGYVDIMINKGIATILVTSNSVEYGTPADFTQLVFVTAPSHLSSKVVYDTTYEGKKYSNGEIISAGTYYFTCWIEDDNYTSEVYEFSYVVNKKVIDIEFINSEGKEVTTYTTAYGKEVDVNVTMYDANHVGDKRTYLMRDADSMYKTIIYRYTSRTGPHYDSFVAPSDIETYDLTVTLVHDNYVATRTIIYKVTKGTVENIEFHQETLMEQTYGSVVAPIITTTPAGVSYYIVYQGFNTTMPTDAGTYNITVYIDDENYEADQISAVFMIRQKELAVKDIVVKDKVYDGTSTVEISGRLDGMLYGDEVLLRMEATTFDNKTNVGKHYVTITNYVISGLQSTNYALEEPVCDKQITIYNNKVQDKQSSSYILSTKNGFASGTTVEFNTMKLESNQTSVWTKMLGVEARAVAYSILVNDNPTINSDQYKICVEIPKKYLDKEFTVKFDGALLGQNISYTREGNYLTFYASSSTGTVVFELAEFNYTYVVILASLAIILIAIVVVLILNPLQHRRKVTAKETEKSAINYIKKNS